MTQFLNFICAVLFVVAIYLGRLLLLLALLFTVGVLLFVLVVHSLVYFYLEAIVNLPIWFLKELFS